ncbi:MAG TPA: DUF4386 domain-containing protein, partial [Candidatus Tumulicola sp.]|nr:DUF4386 domain-containing protein [Candidatus Tumulicola sp.]
LLNPVSYAEFSIYPKLVIPGQLEQTVANIAAQPTLFLVAAFCYLISFIGDVVIAWALYVLLAPVNAAVSLLAAWFRLIYAAMALTAWLNLVVVYRLVTTPEYRSVFGARPLGAQIDLHLHTFRYGWSLSLLIFGSHLLLVGALIFRSAYVPRILGVILAIDGLAWIVSVLQPYFYPNANVGFLFVAYFGELLFMLWLLIMGWRVPEPPIAHPQSDPARS